MIDVVPGDRHRGAVTNLLLFVGGLAGLVVGAELLVRGASRLALSFGVSPLVVGLTVVAFGTGSPELAVTIGAGLDGNAGVAVGNVVGSNVLNVLLILGAAALITPLFVDAQIVRQEVPIMIGASLLLLPLGIDGRLDLLDGTVLLGAMVAYTAFLIVQSRRQTADRAPEDASEVPRAGWDRHWTVQLLLVAVGLAALVQGADWFVTAAVSVASAMGLSDVVIGLTIVAAGTSMPEVATSIMAAIRGERDIAIGNVVGSNVFNILGCLGATALIAPGGIPVAPSILNFDVWIMLAAALACLPVFLTGREIARWEGAVFVGYYVAYVAYLILAAQNHDVLPAFSRVMMTFVVPITIVTLVASLLRARH